MEKELIKLWEQNKHKLRNYFETTNQDEYSDYKTILKKVLELCLVSDELQWNLSAIRTIESGSDQGILIYVFHKNTTDYSVENFAFTHVYYGTCDHCDTLCGIKRYSDGLPSCTQVTEYMTLALHLVQKMRFLE